MTSSNKNNNSNSNNQPKQKETNVNKYTDFFPGFKLQQEQYSKVKTPNGKPWPRAKSPFELRYEQFIIDVVNPSNNCYFTPLDENNIPIKMVDDGPACRHVVGSIVRIRLVDGTEKLYSIGGQLIGYDGASIRRTMSCDKPEVVELVKFGQDKRYNQKTRRFDVYTTGPVGIETKYLLDFNKENFDKLYAKTWDGKNEYFKPNRRNSSKRVTLIVKDESSGIAKEVYFASLERSIDIFLTRSFEDLITDAYLPRSLLEQKRMFSSGYLEEQQKLNPTPTATETATTIPAPDIKKTDAYK